MAVVLKKSKAILTEPLDVGEGKLSLVDVIAQAEGALVSAGVCEVWASAPIEFDYDNDCAVCYSSKVASRSTRVAPGSTSSQVMWSSSPSRPASRSPGTRLRTAGSST